MKSLLSLGAMLAVLLCPIAVKADTIVTQYSTDGRNWVTGTSFTAQADTTLYYRGYNTTRNLASAVQSVRLLVDKQAPTAPVVVYGADGQWTNRPPVMTWTSGDLGGSGINRYEYQRSDRSGWQNYGASTSWTPELNSNISIVWRAVDNAGNVSAESNRDRKSVV